GVVPGGGLALLYASAALDELISRTEGHVQQGAKLLQRALRQPLHHIAANCGLDGQAITRKTLESAPGVGLDARSGRFVDLAAHGVIDPVRVSYCAVRNAASVAGLILTTQTLVAKKPETIDPTLGPAMGGGAEKLGRA
ncbi:MAG: chaperonin GroEL, partial [Burkholderiales bacterium]|nr:chaperonin GroEL [Burkholderiales bacterium]